MSGFAFVKIEGCGNDYVFVDAGLTRNGVGPDALGSPAGLARAVSDRHYGVGSDGLILITPGERHPVRMRMWNADGSESALCLNGLRGVAKYAADALSGLDDAFVVETGAGERPVRIVEGRGEHVTIVEVLAGTPDYHRESVPAAGEGDELWDEPFATRAGSLRGGAVSVGNPHLVLWMDNEPAVLAAPLEVIGPPLETDPRFPERINVHLAAAAAPDRLVMRSWERGSGITLACGSGAAAVFAVFRRLGQAAAEAVVAMPGGEVTLRDEADGRLILTGPAREVFRGRWP
jgi:diaminopimelate epimerase